MKKILQTDNLYRSGYPERLTDLNIDKVRIVINLQTGFWELFNSERANAELRHCLRFRIQLFDFSLAGFLAPDVQTIVAILQIMEHAEGKILIHCRHGRERTGLIVALYRMYCQSWSMEAAYREMVDEGCRWPIRWIWKRVLNRAAVEIKGEVK